LLLVDAVGDFVIEAVARAEEGYFGVGIEEVENAAGCYLDAALKVNVNSLFLQGDSQCWAGRTSPPPMTRTFLFLTCQARIREPPPSTSGYWWWFSMFVLRCGIECSAVLS
jgi:hypothetical protein